MSSPRTTPARALHSRRVRTGGAYLLGFSLIVLGQSAIFAGSGTEIPSRLDREGVAVAR